MSNKKIGSALCKSALKFAQKNNSDESCYYMIRRIERDKNEKQFMITMMISVQDMQNLAKNGISLNEASVLDLINFSMVAEESANKTIETRLDNAERDSVKQAIQQIKINKINVGDVT